MNNSHQAIIQIKDLHHTYMRDTPLQVQALKGVDMEIFAGEAVGIIGRTGSGKSTVVQHFNGLIRPRSPGVVVIDGQDMSSPNVDVKALRRKIGLVFQYPEQQLFERLVGDDIAYGLRQMGMERAKRRGRIQWAMDTVGLPFEKFKDRFTFSLSGGEMRKAALAGVLVLQPKVLILDESTSGVDPRGRKDILSRLLNLHREEGVTLIFVSPNMEDVAELVDRIYVLDDGRTVMSGTTREIFSQPEVLTQYGLGVPQITEVGHRLQAQNFPLARLPLTVAEAEEDIWKILNS
ncbi:MAG: energy-coupling factor transporter ATPase [Anaerolineae bacterium]